VHSISSTFVSHIRFVLPITPQPLNVALRIDNTIEVCLVVLYPVCFVFKWHKISWLTTQILRAESKTLNYAKINICGAYLQRSVFRGESSTFICFPSLCSFSMPRSMHNMALSTVIRQASHRFVVFAAFHLWLYECQNYMVISIPKISPDVWSRFPVDLSHHTQADRDEHDGLGAHFKYDSVWCCHPKSPKKVTPLNHPPPTTLPSIKKEGINTKRR
jgi:hypothetical protein